MSFLSRPKPGFPRNFLRTAFQIGTSLYKGCKSPATEFGVVSVMADTLTPIAPREAKLMGKMTDNATFQAGYFANQQRGALLYCSFYDPKFLDKSHQTQAVILGKFRGSKDSLFELEPYFTYVGRDYPNGTIPRVIASVCEFEDDNNMLCGLANLDRFDEIIESVCTADLLLRQLLSNTAMTPVEHFKSVQALSNDDLTAHANHIEARTYWTLEQDAGGQFTTNIPLNTYATGPVI